MLAGEEHMIYKTIEEWIERNPNHIGMLPIEVCHQIWGTKKKEWVGLTKDEVNNWELPELPTVYEFAKFVEAKLKEKNHG